MSRGFEQVDTPKWRGFINYGEGHIRLCDQFERPEFLFIVTVSNPIHPCSGELGDRAQARMQCNTIQPAAMEDEVALPVQAVKRFRDKVFDRL